MLAEPIITEAPSYSFTQSESQLQIAEMIRRFGEQHIRPFIMEWDEAQAFPKDLFTRLGELGLMGILVPEEYGGSGLGYFEYVTALTEIGRFCPSVGLGVAAHNSLCTGHILQFGTENQKQKYLPKLASGEWIGAWGLTEANTGSDAGGMNTTAVKDGDHWVLNGSKNFITHGITGDVAVVIARTSEKRTKSNATAFIVERGTPGFQGGRKENKVGMRASETAEMLFDNVRIPDAQRLGEVGDGFHQSMKVLDGGRISIAALAIGNARGAFDAALKYSKERVQFDQPICNFQGIQFKLADMITEIESAELLTLRAAYLKNNHLPVTLASAIAKYKASEVAVRVSEDGVQIHGGYGYIKDYPAEKFWRDSKLLTIGEGTSEIQKMVIARELIKQ